MATLPTDYTDATTPTGATTELPATTSRGINAINTEINAKASLTGAETLTNKTLTTPKISSILDTNGNVWVAADPVTSAVNYMALKNGASPNGPVFHAAGSDSNISVWFQPKGDGGFNVFQEAGTKVTFSAYGNNTDIDLNFVTQNAGVVKANDNVVFHAGAAVPAANITSGITNGNTAQQSQTVVSATNYYITNSNLNLPNPMKTGLVVGSRFRWTVAMAKTAAGTGIFQMSIYRGTNGSTADTQDVLQTIGTQTAVVDSMTVDVEVVITTTGATGAYFWSIIPMQRAATATGFGVATGATGQFSGTVSSVNLTTASLKFGLGFKATTGTPTVTVPLVRAQALNVV